MFDHRLSLNELIKVYDRVKRKRFDIDSWSAFFLFNFGG